MDIDVSADFLASPPVAAAVTSYRPAVGVTNHGLASAEVTGTMRIYDRATGLLTQTLALYKASIPTGQTEDVEATGYWTPTQADVGKEFLFIADITTTGDMVEPNNHLAPVTVLITAEEPPPPPPVTSHATQHEEGGGDEVDVDGLRGKLADRQRAELHHTEHEAGAADEIDVSNLPGQLLEAQVPTGHKVSHMDGGSDELDITGLKGLLGDEQTPLDHGNEVHNPTFFAETGSALCFTESGAWDTDIPIVWATQPGHLSSGDATRAGAHWHLHACFICHGAAGGFYIDPKIEIAGGGAVSLAHLPVDGTADEYFVIIDADVYFRSSAYPPTDTGRFTASLRAIITDFPFSAPLQDALTGFDMVITGIKDPFDIILYAKLYGTGDPSTIEYATGHITRDLNFKTWAEA
jgi:hypothetical protein